MITDKVIKEIYRKFSRPPKDREELQLDYFIPLLQENHNLSVDDDEIILSDLEEFNPFRRFLIRRVCGILEFTKFIAIVLPTHILFLGKDDKAMRIHMKPAKQPSLMDRIFGRTVISD